MSTKQKHPGRPEVGRPVNVRLGDDLLADVDEYAAAEGIARAEAIRHLLRRGLKRGKR
ncbi:transcriptional repressor [Mycobacterium phage GreaseLightnin]|uniref:Ribbon-helix-helix DNA binding domain protein n=3 Tax=Caudoviricetes TaxID=2731619 RepID=A0A143FPU3_9CAUD|nr:transcriptional repressor [Mycobacterium phage Shipwreck]YP_009964563.1 transcriptional repressor [Mycobacterium phage GreaseLightnin]YP_009964721.1 transcriptional repressor [Mycobacterium phage Phineas]ASD53697.1 ribbon-helix-helix DNA binding domain protein [Mycobacterium phage Bogie]QDH85032.1 ribbon-helix-helix DNA binding domain protein [Mycobacterium phage HUHilltop]QDH92952.1 ribbon-helix-helix DNA binding domain protein [Mycobacterium phage Necropolis]UYL87598.1 ribbon-helix-helix